MCLQAVQWNSLQGPVQPHEVIDLSVDKLNSWRTLPTYFECHLHFSRTRLAQWSNHLNSVQDEAFIEEFHKVANQSFRLQLSLGLSESVCCISHYRISIWAFLYFSLLFFVFFKLVFLYFSLWLWQNRPWSSTSTPWVALFQSSHIWTGHSIISTTNILDREVGDWGGWCYVGIQQDNILQYYHQQILHWVKATHWPADRADQGVLQRRVRPARHKVVLGSHSYWLCLN